METIKKLTARQQEVLDLVADYIADHGFPPTIYELSGLMGCRSPNAANDHLRALQRKGAITITPGVSRGITITGQSVEDEAIALIRALLNGDDQARENAIAFLEMRGVEL
ncbi:MULTISPECIES: LexA family protein [Atlantibacter]|uniref:Repressor LexA n=1 Tax=Atlantibacter hermannii NBRC 105704 TaxID=1115512 RepID=H5UYY7_ATLHE|nr:MULTISPECIES: LexA family transcriptional regulator [Atlantibacter]MDW4574553.1 LexA family transcriptional regulator [Atlantibacter hermannii]GAB50141.1 repressor LexA [Atlantibacter hermannii NBRC 105704]